MSDQELLELLKQPEMAELIKYMQRRLKEQREESDEFVVGTLSYQSVNFHPELEVNMEEIEDSKVYEVYDNAEDYKEYLKEKFQEMDNDDVSVVSIGPVIFSRGNVMMYIFLSTAEAKEFFDALPEG